MNYLSIKNNSKDKIKGYSDDGLHIFAISKSEALMLEKEIDASYLQFYWCIEGNGVFSFNDGSYKLPISPKCYFLFYNPQKDLPLDLNLSENTTILIVFIKVTKFHQMFVNDFRGIQFLNSENVDKKYYLQEEIAPLKLMIINQLFSFNLNEATRPLYYKAKVYELLANYFGKSNDDAIENCPYLRDEENVAKIKKAKDILLENIKEPPTIKELSIKVDLQEHKLKEGFKNLYGDTIYSYLMDYKMNYALQLLEDGKKQIKEVSYEVGYENPSHFIAAFKRKFEVTPKQYYQSKN